MRKTPALALAAALLLPLGLAACEDDAPVTVQSEQGSDSTAPSEESTKTSNTDGEETSVFDITKGDCFNNPASDDTVNKVYVVSCDAPHDAEVYAEGDITGYDTYPGDATIQTEAQTICSDGFKPYVGTDYSSSSYGASWFFPIEESWNNVLSPDRTISCLLMSTDGSQLTGSGHDSGK